MRCPSRNRAGLLVVVLSIALGGCGSASPGSETVDPAAGSTLISLEPTVGTLPATTQSPLLPALVGEWQRETTCEELAGALRQAGMDWAVLDNVVGNGFLPGVTNIDQVADEANPCEGAVPRLHSHFFTETGEFGSKDWTGQQVDAGAYEVVDENTVTIGDLAVAFDFAIVGDALTLEPAIPECAPERCFEAVWAVAVAYPGQPWQRVGKAP